MEGKFRKRKRETCISIDDNGVYGEAERPMRENFFSGKTEEVAIGVAGNEIKNLLIVGVKIEESSRRKALYRPTLRL